MGGSGLLGPFRKERWQFQLPDLAPSVRETFWWWLCLEVLHVFLILPQVWGCVKEKVEALVWLQKCRTDVWMKGWIWMWALAQMCLSRDGGTLARKLGQKKRNGSNWLRPDQKFGWKKCRCGIYFIFLGFCACLFFFSQG